MKNVFMILHTNVCEYGPNMSKEFYLVEKKIKE